MEGSEQSGLQRKKNPNASLITEESILSTQLQLEQGKNNTYQADEDPSADVQTSGLSSVAKSASPPSDFLYKISVNSAWTSLELEGSAARGEQNREGVLLDGFAKRISTPSVLVAETPVIRKALNWGKENRAA